MTEAGYYRYATICGDTLVFTCEDDLWLVTTSGGTAHRLTTGRGEFWTPKLSPDGKFVAFVGREEGHPEVYVIPVEGGLPRRLTFVGADTCFVSGWSPDGKEIFFVTDAYTAFVRHSEAYAVSLKGGEPRPLRHGLVSSYAVQSNGATVIGRNANDPARWKRYRGGTAGELWIDPDGKGK
ncbi:MAG: PD40 domain-containing protein, partial [Cyanobacteria bacterium SZAS LIN-5]|nr:PD40 domain-containing protein [Cyanobacteria bacterium SZAS LIN-5]